MFGVVFYCIYRYCAILSSSGHLSLDNIIQKCQVCTFSPFIGNLAFPDNSAIYFICFLPPGQEVGYYYSCVEQFNLFSITFYNTLGEIIEYNDDKVYSEKYVTPQYCAVIVRIYSETPSLSMEKFVAKHKLNMSVIKENTNYITLLYKRILGIRKIYWDRSINSFRFSKQPISLFYPNPRAKYLILPLDTIRNTVVIRAKKPLCGFGESIRYFGFMACNMRTTETDDCVSCYDLADSYTLFVARNCECAEAYGYDKNDSTHKCLIWTAQNENPIIVYREIRMDNNVLFSLSNDATPFEIQTKMKEYYPSVTIYPY